LSTLRVLACSGLCAGKRCFECLAVCEFVTESTVPCPLPPPPQPKLYLSLTGGLDSLGAVEYVNLMSRRFALPLPSTLVFDAPTTTAITSYIASKLVVAAEGGAADGSTSAASTSARTARRQQQLRRPPSKLPASGGTDNLLPPPVVSILGTVLRPLVHPPAAVGQASAAAAAGSLLPALLPVSDRIVQVPHARWEVDAATPAVQAAAASIGSTGGRFGAFLQDVELFDASAFSLLPAEAAAMDPQHRILLESAGQLLTSCSPAATSSGGGGNWLHTGVFVGISWTEYHKLSQLHGVAATPYSAQGAVLSVACGRCVGGSGGGWRFSRYLQ